MFERKSLKWPITLAVTMIVLLVGLMIGWVLLNVFNALSSETSSNVYWFLLSIGSAMFATVVVGVVLYLVLSIQQINLNRRQSNFIDSVTHELKSPIASMKLYLQTLTRRKVTPDQQQEFYEAMLMDIERLDTLITQLLDVARISHQSSSQELEISVVCVDELIRNCAEDLSRTHQIKEPVIQLNLAPVTLECPKVDLDIVFRNLIDNAIKYSGTPPQINVQLDFDESSRSLIASVSDNGRGIPRTLRRRIFNRFFRIGDELERTKPGTGLGLFLVKSILKRMKGKIAVVEPGVLCGATFEVCIPGASLRQNSASDCENTTHTLPN